MRARATGASAGASAVRPGPTGIGDVKAGPANDVADTDDPGEIQPTPPARADSDPSHRSCTGSAFRTDRDPDGPRPARAHRKQTGDPAQDRLRRARRLHLWLLMLLIVCAAVNLATGATGTSLWGALAKLMRAEALTPLEAVVLWDIRAPRLTLGLLVGAALAVSGTVMQGLFRNPLADPGLVGVSAGAGLGAISAIVLGGALTPLLGAWTAPLAAFLGSWGTVLLLYRVATRQGRTSVATLLLAGIAFAALASALAGIVIFAADDQQLRDLTFWGLGSLAGARWAKVLAAGPMIALATVAACYLARGLNGLALGEAAAHHLGFDVQWLKHSAVLCVAGATGAAVAVSGGIGFVGIVVPHLLRLGSGPDHGPLLVNAALLGAALLVLADVIARLVVAPAELPIGIVTAVLGAPVFLWILLRQRGMAGL